MELAGRLTVDSLTWEVRKEEYGGLNGYEIRVQPPQAQWQKISDRHMRLVWNDFEPRTDPEKRRIFLVAYAITEWYKE